MVMSIPYNFVSGSEGNPSYSDRIAELTTFIAFELANPDFQDEYGYCRRAWSGEYGFGNQPSRASI